MTNYEKISQLEESERKLFHRQKRKGNSGEIMKQKNKTNDVVV